MILQADPLDWTENKKITNTSITQTKNYSFSLEMRACECVGVGVGGGRGGGQREREMGVLAFAVQDFTSIINAANKKGGGYYQYHQLQLA